MNPFVRHDFVRFLRAVRHTTPVGGGRLAALTSRSSCCAAAAAGLPARARPAGSRSRGPLRADRGLAHLRSRAPERLAAIVGFASADDMIPARLPRAGDPGRQQLAVWRRIPVEARIPVQIVQKFPDDHVAGADVRSAYQTPRGITSGAARSFAAARAGTGRPAVRDVVTGVVETQAPALRTGTRNGRRARGAAPALRHPA